MNTQLTEIVNKLDTPHIFVLGDLILDHYIFGSVTRVSQEAPVQILDAKYDEYRPGGASNVAANLASLHANTSCGGTIGQDLNGDKLLGLLKELGDTNNIIRDNTKQTPTKVRMLANNQQILRVDYEQATTISNQLQQQLLSLSLKQSIKSDLIVISDYNKGTLTKDLCINFIKRAGRPIIVGLKGNDYKKYAGVTGVSLNQAELLKLSGKSDINNAAQKIIKELRLKFLIVTMGPKGLQVHTKKSIPITLPTMAQQVYDVTGAGDTVLAAFSLGYASRLSLYECATLANAAAGIVVSKVGTETTTRDELLSINNTNHKIIELPSLIEKIKHVHKNKRIAFTNGCFDIMHVGHLSSLQFARSKGDILIVGLDSDNSVRKLKGNGRPIISQDKRAQMLASLEVVDYVIIFDKLTPILKSIKPDVLIKGEDYKGKKIIGSSYAGKVELAPFIEGISTTEIIKRINGEVHDATQMPNLRR